MNYDDADPSDLGDRWAAAAQPSATERQLRRLVVPEPADFAPDKRLDVIHDPDLDLLWGGQA